MVARQWVSSVSTRQETGSFNNIQDLTESVNGDAIWQHAIDADLITPVEVRKWYADMARRSAEGTFVASVLGTFASRSR